VPKRSKVKSREQRRQRKIHTVHGKSKYKLKQDRLEAMSDLGVSTPSEVVSTQLPPGEYQGRLLKLFRRKGYGFIDQGLGDVGIYFSMDDAVHPVFFRDGDMLVYRTTEGLHGPKAIDVRKRF
jgi:hypothetical protein